MDLQSPNLQLSGPVVGPKPQALSAQAPTATMPPSTAGNFNVTEFVKNARSKGVPDKNTFEYLQQKGFIDSAGKPVSQASAQPQQPPAKPPGFWSRLGTSLKEGSVGQELIGIGKGIGSTISGISTAGQKGLELITSPLGKMGLKGFAGGENKTKTANETFGAALAPAGGWQKVGYGLEQAGELVAPTGVISEGKDFMQGVGEAAKLPELAKSGKIGKAIAWTAQKVLSALPEAAFGTTYGLSKGETPKEAVKTGATFGMLSGLGEVVGDTWRAFKGGLAENVQKAIGFTGKMTPTQAAEKIPQSIRALKTISNMAEGLVVKDINGIEKAFEPGKATFYETMQALSGTKKNIYNAYTELASQAGEQGAKFTGKDFGSVIDTLKASTQDTTSAFKSKAASLVKDIEDNFGIVDPKTGKVNFKNLTGTELDRIQSFIEKINTDINPLSDKAGSEVSATLSKKLREIMDSKIEGVTGESYQKLRNSYSDLKSIENDIVNQFKKSSRKIGGGFGQYIEGFGTLDTILGALSSNPLEMVKGVGMGILGKVMQYLRDPEVNLQNAFNLLTETKAPTPLKNRLFGGAAAPTQLK